MVMPINTKICFIVCLFSLAACGEITSDIYESHDNPSCKVLCDDICTSCHVLHFDIYNCTIDCDRECDWNFCDTGINRHSSNCKQIFTNACSGTL
jgi:hypothetical protein